MSVTINKMNLEWVLFTPDSFYRGWCGSYSFRSLHIGPVGFVFYQNLIFSNMLTRPKGVICMYTKKNNQVCHLCYRSFCNSSALLASLLNRIFFRHVDEARRGNLHVHRKRTIKSAIFDTGLSVILLCRRNNDNCFLQKWPFLKKWNKLHKSREGCLENMTKGTFRNIKNRRLSFKWFRREKKRSCLGSVQRTLHSVRLC